MTQDNQYWTTEISPNTFAKGLGLKELWDKNRTAKANSAATMQDPRSFQSMPCSSPHPDVETDAFLVLLNSLANRAEPAPHDFQPVPCRIKLALPDYKGIRRRSFHYAGAEVGAIPRSTVAAEDDVGLVQTE